MRPLTLVICVSIIAALFVTTCGCTSSSNSSTSATPTTSVTPTTSATPGFGTLSADNLAGAINDLYTSKNYTVNTPFTMTKTGDTITYHGVVTDGPKVATPYKRNVTVVLVTDRTAAFAAYQAAINEQKAQGFQEFISSNASQAIYWVGYLGTTFSSNPSTPKVNMNLNEPTSIGLILGGEYNEYLNSANVNNYYQVLTDQQALAT